MIEFKAIVAIVNLSSIDRVGNALIIALNSIIEGRRSSVETGIEMNTDLQLKIAAQSAIQDYTSDRELTIFTNLDGEDFLE